jgi:hypothetical protein
MASFEVVAGGSVRTSTKGETYDWKENGATSVNPIHHDIGLIYLTDAIVLPSYPTLADAKAADGASAVDVGRIKGGAVTNDIFSAPITLSDAVKVGYPFDYVAAGVIEHGDSGGPVFAAGTQKIVAVNSGAGGNIEVLARVDLLRSWILARLPSTAAPPPPPPPAPAPPPAVDAGTPPAAACAATEAEPNDTVAKATPLKTNACGKLGTTTDVDWYTLTATAGVTTLSVSGDADVTASVGLLSAGTCLPLGANFRAASIAVKSGTANFCISVTSAGHKLQGYRLAAAK